jgi:ribosomal protein S11
MKKKLINFIIKRNFTTAQKLSWNVDPKKFIKLHTFKSNNLFYRKYLQFNMEHNTIFFCTKYWEMSNIGNYVWPIIINISTLGKTFENPNPNYLKKFKFSNFSTRNSFFNKFDEILELKENNIFLKKNIILLKDFISKDKNKSSTTIWTKKSKKFNKKDDFITKQEDNNLDDSDRLFIRGFLFLRSKKNNFFVTVVDNIGWTIITRSGGNSERTGPRQRSSVLSADHAIYEACFLAKSHGIESLSVHVRSTLWLPQIKNSLDGLETSGLLIDELIYRPLKAFGGCRSKKPRRV